MPQLLAPSATPGQPQGKLPIVSPASNSGNSLPIIPPTGNADNSGAANAATAPASLPDIVPMKKVKELCWVSCSRRAETSSQERPYILCWGIPGVELRWIGEMSPCDPYKVNDLFFGRSKNEQ